MAAGRTSTRGGPVTTGGGLRGRSRRDREAQAEKGGSTKSHVRDRRPGERAQGKQAREEETSCGVRTEAKAGKREEAHRGESARGTEERGQGEQAGEGAREHGGEERERAGPRDTSPPSIWKLAGSVAPVGAPLSVRSQLAVLGELGRVVPLQVAVHAAECTLLVLMGERGGGEQLGGGRRAQGPVERRRGGKKQGLAGAGAFGPREGGPGWSGGGARETGVMLAAAAISTGAEVRQTRPSSPRRPPQAPGGRGPARRGPRQRRA